MGLHQEPSPPPWGVSAKLPLRLLISPSTLTLLLPSGGQRAPFLCLRVIKTQVSSQDGHPGPQRERPTAEDKGDGVEKKKRQGVWRTGLPAGCHDSQASSTWDRQREGQSGSRDSRTRRLKCTQYGEGHRTVIPSPGSARPCSQKPEINVFKKSIYVHTYACLVGSRLVQFQWSAVCLAGTQYVAHSR